MIAFVPKYLKGMGGSAVTYRNIAGLFMGGSALGKVTGDHFGDRYTKCKRAAEASYIKPTITEYLQGCNKQNNIFLY
jgi:hypothetical protein